jgi:hypothetical protein
MNQSELKSINEAITYINSLELPHTDESIRGLTSSVLKLDDKKKSANVMAGAIVCFIDDISAQQKSDVLNSTLLAQLAANKKFDRVEQIKDWYKAYNDTLTTLGWVLQASNSVNYKSDTTSYEMGVSATVTLAVATASVNKGLIVNSAIGALKDLQEDSKAFTIWNSTTHSKSGGNVSVLLCEQSNKTVFMHNETFHFDASNVEVDSHFLWHRWASTDINLYQGSNKWVLNYDVYNQLRNTVTNKLGDKATLYSEPLDV